MDNFVYGLIVTSSVHILNKKKNYETDICTFLNWIRSYSVKSRYDLYEKLFHVNQWQFCKCYSSKLESYKGSFKPHKLYFLMTLSHKHGYLNIL